jgi:hypothetical protein
VVIALVPQHAEKIKPPRTLAVPYELGRPLGVPNDPAFQHRVLTAALELFSHSGEPIFSQHEEVSNQARIEDEENFSCPVTFTAKDPTLTRAEQVEAELELLRPWYDRGFTTRKSTSVGLADIDINSAVKFLGSLVTPSTTVSSPAKHLNLAEAFKCCAEDLKAFYNEAVTSQPGNISSVAAENWYWGQTLAGQMIRDLRLAYLESEDPELKVVANFILVPRKQTYRDE